MLPVKDAYKIILVDDDQAMIEWMMALIDKVKPEYIVYQSSKVNKALDLIESIHPDILVIEWNMSDTSVKNLLLSLQSKTTTRNLPIVVLDKAANSAVNLPLAFNSGAVDYIAKPLNQDEFIFRLQAALTVNAIYQREIALKEKELSEKTLQIVKSNNFNKELIHKIDELKELIDTGNFIAQRKVKEIKKEMKSKIMEDVWEKYEISFDKVHPKFKRNILRAFSNLTGAELRLCSFIRLGLSIKEMAGILNLSPESIKVSRSRLRKKLELETGQNLETFMENF